MGQQEYQAGANMAFKAFGISDQMQQRQMMQQLQEQQMGQQALQMQLIQAQIKAAQQSAEKITKEQAWMDQPASKFMQPETKSVPAPEYQPGGGMPPFAPGATIQQPTGGRIFSPPQGATAGQVLQMSPLQEAFRAKEYKPSTEEAAIRLKQAEMQPQQGSADIQAYNLAKSQGFTGTLLDFYGAKAKEPTEPSDIRIFEMETGTPASQRGTQDYQNAMMKWRKGKGEAYTSNIFIGTNPLTGDAQILPSRGKPIVKEIPSPEGGIGSKVLSEDFKKDYTAVGQAYDLIKGLKDQWNSLGAGGRFDVAKIYGEALVGSNPDAKLYISARESFLGNLSRSLAAERGVLTQQDIERIAKALPRIGPNPLTSDNKEEADKKWEFIGKIIANAEKRMKERQKMTPANIPSITSGATGGLRDRAISELNKRGKVVNEQSIKKAMELLGGK